MENGGGKKTINLFSKKSDLKITYAQAGVLWQAIIDKSNYSVEIESDKCKDKESIKDYGFTVYRSSSQTNFQKT